jgi:hypothetical protein
VHCVPVLRARRAAAAPGHFAGALDDFLYVAEAATTGNLGAFPWRSGAALVLHALARPEEALSLVREELGLARVWHAASRCGRALC